MVITIDVAPELARQLRDEAARAGLDTGVYLANTLQEFWRHKQGHVPHLSEAESRLLQQINLGLSPEQWQRYHH